MPPLKAITPLLEKDLASEISSGFPLAYQQLLHAVAEKNKEVLESCLEPKAFSTVIEGLEQLTQKGQKVTLVNESAPIEVTLHNASIHIGPFVDRAKNEKLKLVRKALDDPKMKRVTEICMYKGSSLFTLPQSFILQLDCLIKSAAKLVLEDESGAVVKGTKDESIESHLLRFEVANERVRGLFKLQENFIRYFRYAADVSQANPFAEGQWIVTDIDNTLRGNQLVKETAEET